MSLKSKIEAIIYAAEEPVTAEQILAVLAEVAPEELAAPLTTAGPSAPETPPNPPSADSAAPEVSTETAANTAPDAKTREKAERAEMRSRIRHAIEELSAEYDAADRGMEIRAIAGGYRMATRPEHHDAVRAFARSLKPPVRLSLPALETLAVIAYKQPVTVPEISEVRGVDSSGVIGTLLDRKLVTTAGRKQVIGRPILYKTTKEFLLRFGLKDVSELPSMEEFEQLATSQADLLAEPVGSTAQEDGDTPPAKEPPSGEAPVEEPPQQQPPLTEPPSHEPPEKTEAAEAPAEQPSASVEPA